MTILTTATTNQNEFTHFVIKEEDGSFTYLIELTDPSESENKEFWRKNFKTEEQALGAMLNQIVLDEQLEDVIEITAR